MKLSCGHWSSITGTARPVGLTMPCSKCESDTTVVAVRKLKDTAKLPSETRKAKDADAHAVATDRPTDVAARHWPVASRRR